MDFESAGGSASTHEASKLVSMALGVILILLGLAALLSVSKEILSAFNGPMEHQFIAKMTTIMSGSQITVDGRVVEFNKEAVIWGAFILFGLLATLGIMIATVFMNAGVRLLAPDASKDIWKIKVRLEEIIERISDRRQ